MTSDAMWNAFADAIVRIEFSAGPAVLAPNDVGEVGSFPFDAAVHIITAYNPAGIETNVVANEKWHQDLGLALADYDVVRTVGSARDGTMSEPGYAALGLTVVEAQDLGGRFGQRAIYRWTVDALTIVGVDEPIERRLGWSLEAAHAN